MKRFTKVALSVLKQVFLDFFLKNEHHCQITDVFKKTDKLHPYASYVHDYVFRRKML